MNRYQSVAEYYDAENERLAMLRRDVPFFLAQLPKRGRLSILELASGTARAAIPIAQAGHRVVGVDNNRGMLEMARRKRDGVGLGERELKLVHGDVLQLKLGRKFDRVCLLFNTMLAFTTIEQQDRLLAGVRNHLKPGGRFWVDIFNPDMMRLAVPRAMGIDATLMFLPGDGRSVLRTVDVRRDLARQVQRITFQYRWFDGHGVQKKRKAEFDLTYIFPRELRLLVERNGMAIEKMYGNYDGSGVTGDSPRIIAMCKRA